MVRFESVRLQRNETGSVTIYPVIVFSFQETYGLGLIKTTNEYTLYYSTSEKSWSGDVIDSSGWRDLSFNEVADIVKRKNLERMV